MGGKYRDNKIKQEHTVLDEIMPFLEEIAKLTPVKSIIPGRINRRKGSGIQAYLQLKYNTPSGLKIIGKTSSSLQEVFVVTDEPEKTVKLLKEKDFVK
ncbi:DUF2103 domain-containing protein [Halothermothrix orenii]|uniref:Metal-binding protein n=1 Tax=Halothermothrix orenii (strain H 168 / OCM 544 / DSM 9562) TaxID=373903 RepID=B8CXC9_HALOH|nr:DUF2103 domain-containing protein [Halothermothrix orenii]ACL69948.1 hypothetical protein Hore_11980 [Halothermothrix orenii H 168]